MAIEDTVTEIETGDTAAAMTVERGSTTAMGMMILANGGISSTATSGLLGGSLAAFSVSFLPFNRVSLANLISLLPRSPVRQTN